MIKKMFLYIMGTLSLPIYSYSKVNPTDIERLNISGNNIKINTRKMVMIDICNRLIKLNEKNKISISEAYVEQKLFELVEKISKSPIDYCEDIQMAQVVEQDPL